MTASVFPLIVCFKTFVCLSDSQQSVPTHSLCLTSACSHILCLSWQSEFFKTFVFVWQQAAWSPLPNVYKLVAQTIALKVNSRSAVARIWTILIYPSTLAVKVPKKIWLACFKYTFFWHISVKNLVNNKRFCATRSKEWMQKDNWLSYSQTFRGKTF